MECKNISDHKFKFFENKKNFLVYKCEKCGMTWEEMVEIRETQAKLAKKTEKTVSKIGEVIEEMFNKMFKF